MPYHVHQHTELSTILIQTIVRMSYANVRLLVNISWRYHYIGTGSDSICTVYMCECIGILLHYVQ